jgi:Uma2 family endonuclease
MKFATGHSVPQTDPPLSPRLTLPTMYDLPSEFPEEPGLPDEFHDLQPQLLSRTLSLVDYSRENWFTGTDLNVYYDVQHPLWHKRPDWFLAVGVSRLYDGHDLRLSYVVWQEGVTPAVVVEFLSPGTAQEDLGRFHPAYRGATGDNQPSTHTQAGEATAKPPSKFTVYERRLKIPHYIVYSRYTQELRYFKLVGACYEEQRVHNGVPAIWLTDLKLGLGLWVGEFGGIEGHWLRWCDQNGNWLLTDTEQESLAREQERLAREQAQQQVEIVQRRAERLAQRLRELGVDPDEDNL